MRILPWGLLLSGQYSAMGARRPRKLSRAIRKARACYLSPAREARAIPGSRDAVLRDARLRNYDFPAENPQRNTIKVWRSEIVEESSEIVAPSTNPSGLSNTGRRHHAASREARGIGSQAARGRESLCSRFDRR